MFEWFDPWQAWLGVAVLLAAAETLGGDFILLMLAVGAVSGMVAALLTGSLVIPFLVAAGTSVALLGLVRPSILRRLHSGPELRLGHESLVGSQGLVTEEISALTPGRVKLEGEIWSAAPYDEHLSIAAGETVEVYEIRGATAYVHPLPRLDG